MERFPFETLQEAQLAEDLISQGLETLSLNKHEKILFEVHGLDPEQDEEPQFVDRKLQELEKELERINVKEAYDLAKQQNPSYVDSRNLRLMFLRSRKFNCHEAAESLVQHFHVKRTLFGDGDVLSRDVHQSDLGPKDKLLLETGFLQVMPERDAAGRTILLIVCSNVEKFPKDGWEIESEVCEIIYVGVAFLTGSFSNCCDFLTRFDSHGT